MPKPDADPATVAVTVTLSLLLPLSVTQRLTMGKSGSIPAAATMSALMRILKRYVTLCTASRLG